MILSCILGRYVHCKGQRLFSVGEKRGLVLAVLKSLYEQSQHVSLQAYLIHELRSSLYERILALHVKGHI
jgi:hypothetical protein